MLEAFFAEEQFPSRADKLFLAKKAGMSYRQIHVWVHIPINHLALVSHVLHSSKIAGRVRVKCMVTLTTLIVVEVALRKTQT